MIEIQKPEECMGCFACFNVCPQRCITMESDAQGFWYPIVKQNACIKCGCCIDVCPIKNEISIENEPVAYACYNNNEAIRKESSSGGVFTLLAEKVLVQDGVVFGAAFRQDFSVEHCYVRNVNDLGQLRGSKYLQSSIGDTYQQVKEFLEQGVRVLFSGTPCQISGLKSFLAKDYQQLYCIDIICHGVPSPKVWKKYLAFQEELVGSKIRRIAFRRKDDGWKRYSVSLSFNNNTEYLQPLDKDLYMSAFLKDVCLRPTCYDCKFKSLHRESDITLADFWGIENVLPEMDDDQGTSLIFINSATGKAMFDEIKSEVIFKKVEINEAVKYNSAVIKSASYNSKRAGFFEDLDQLPFDRLVKKHCSVAMRARIKRKTRAFIAGSLRKIGLFEFVNKCRNRM